MSNKSDECNFHLYLGKKDYEILSWKNSLPPKCFKFYVEQILLSHINGYSIVLPPSKDIHIECTSKPIHIVIKNEQVIEFLAHIDSGQKSKVVKDIILFYIRESRNFFYISSNKKSKKNKMSFTPPSIVKSQYKKNRLQSTSVTKTVKKLPETTESSSVVSAPTPQTFESNDVIKAPIKENSTTQQKNSQNPLLQALFKMSGDE